MFMFYTKSKNNINIWHIYNKLGNVSLYSRNQNNNKSPMQGKSTYEKKNDVILESTSNYESDEPSGQVLDYLKKFARSYHVETSLPEQFNSLCLN